MEEVPQGPPSVILLLVPLPPSEELLFPASYSMLQSAVRFVLWKALVLVPPCSGRRACLPFPSFQGTTGRAAPGLGLGRSTWSGSAISTWSTGK